MFNETIDRWPPKTRLGPSSELDNVCLRLGLIDVWRCKNPDREEYTWSNKDSSLHSRIDYWLVSNDLTTNVISVLIEPCIMTDHKGVFIKKIIWYKNNQSKT